MNSRTALRSERGAFDLPSIITGVVVVGILTAGVLAAIFGVIPFAQDNGAKQDAAAIRTAQGVAIAKDGKYLDMAGLVAAGYISSSNKAVAAPASGDGYGFVRTSSVGSNLALGALGATVNDTGTCFIAVARSNAGPIYYVTDKVSAPTLLVPGNDVGCLASAQAQELIQAVGGFDKKYIPAVPTGLAGSVPADTTTANFSWPAVPGATGYRVESQIGSGAWTVVAESQTQTTVAVTGVRGQTVSVRVAALNAAGTSAASTVTSVGIPLPTVSWTSQPSLGSTFWGATAVSADGKKIAVTRYQNIYTSTDSGTTWTPHSGLYTASGVSADGSKAVTIGPSGHPYFTSNYGVAWTDDSYVGDGPFSQILMSADGSKTYMKSGANTLLKAYGTWSSSTVRGSAGSSCSTGTTMNSLGTAFTAACGSTYYSTGSDPTGAAWQQKPVAGMLNLASSAASASSQKYVIVGSSAGVVATSTDNGTTWTVRSSLPTGNWQKVGISDDGRRMVAARNGGYVYVSADGGATWSEQTSLGTAVNWSTVSISADGSTALVVPATGTVQIGKLPLGP